MAITVHNHQLSGQSVATPGATVTLGFTPTAGQLLVVIAGSSRVSESISISNDGTAISWTQIGPDAATIARWNSWYGTVGATPPTTITCSQTTSTANWAIGIMEVTGHNAASPAHLYDEGSDAVANNPHTALFDFTTTATTRIMAVTLASGNVNGLVLESGFSNLGTGYELRATGQYSTADVAASNTQIDIEFTTARACSGLVVAIEVASAGSSVVPRRLALLGTG